MTQSNLPVSGDGVDLLRELLQDNVALYPKELTAQFPHIAERIAAIWSQPKEAKPYFRDLLTTEREGRQGFPREIHAEIFALSNFYDASHPTEEQKDDFWRGFSAAQMQAN
jgi:hypothetical protein